MNKMHHSEMLFSLWMYMYLKFSFILIWPPHKFWDGIKWNLHTHKLTHCMHIERQCTSQLMQNICKLVLLDFNRLLLYGTILAGLLLTSGDLYRIRWGWGSWAILSWVGWRWRWPTTLGAGTVWPGLEFRLWTTRGWSWGLALRGGLGELVVMAITLARAGRPRHSSSR